VRGGENRSDQPWAKTTKIQYTHFNLDESVKDSVPGCHNLFTNMMRLGALIFTKQILRFNVNIRYYITLAYRLLYIL